MSCYSPIQGFRTPNGVVFSELSRHDILGSIELPCGMCIGCRMRRATEWSLRVRHEASLYDDNCFVTLTYGPGNLPVNGSLDHSHFQKFMKRLRWSVKPRVRYYMCGEYGEKTFRPHYHGCLFNVDFRDRTLHATSASGFNCYTSEALSKLWPHGIAVVQDLVPETASYCARYIMKKALGRTSETAYQRVNVETGEIYQLAPEYARMSLKPGIGQNWLEKYWTDVYGHDHVIADGTKHRVPRYYDGLIKKLNPGVDLDQLEYDRFVKAMAVVEDNTPERRAVREEVHLAKVSKLSRSLEC